MFDVLVYLYENYWRPDACPEHHQLTRKLSAVGFESDEIQEALNWLDGLAKARRVLPWRSRATACACTPTPSANCWATSRSASSASSNLPGVLPPAMREMVVDRAKAVGSGPIELEDLKIIVLMVFWSLGEEPDALILDELFVARRRAPDPLIGAAQAAAACQLSSTGATDRHRAWPARCAWRAR